MGGLARLADQEAFSRVFTLLRHLLHHPFDIDNTPDASGMGVCEHLACRLNALQQQAGGAVGAVWTARQVHAALTSTLTPYGFRVAGSSGRHGYALGTALLDLDQLVAAQGLLRLQAVHQGDRKAAAISSVLTQRLGWIGVNLDNHPPVRRWLLAAGPPLQRAGRTKESRPSRRPGPSTRVNRPTPHTLSAESPLETAIRQRQRVLLSHQQEGARRSAPRAVWPLQLVLQGERWWLLMEHDAIGQREALLESLPLEEVHVFHQEWRPGRSLEAHCEALARWERLRRHGGSLHVGNDLAAQLALGSAPNPQGVTEGWERLRFCCTPRVMGSIRRELDRFPTSAIRLARPLPGHSWGRPEPRAVLPPAEDPRHPYPVEVALPPWVLAGDPELRRWLFSYGAAIRLEGPRALVEEHRRWLQDALKAQGVSQGVQRVGREDAREQEKTDSAMAGSLMANSLTTSRSKVSASDTAEQENLALTRRHPRKPSGSPGLHSAQLCPLCGGPMVPLAPGGT